MISPLSIGVLTHVINDAKAHDLAHPRKSVVNPRLRFALCVLSCFGTRLAISKTRWMAMLLHITGIACAVMVQYVGKRSGFCWIALAGCALLSACNDTRDLAPATPTTPW